MFSVLWVSNPKSLIMLWLGMRGEGLIGLEEWQLLRKALKMLCHCMLCVSIGCEWFGRLEKKSLFFSLLYKYQTYPYFPAWNAAPPQRCDLHSKRPHSKQREQTHCSRAPHSSRHPKDTDSWPSWRDNESVRSSSRETLAEGPFLTFSLKGLKS